MQLGLICLFLRDSISLSIQSSATLYVVGELKTDISASSAASSIDNQGNISITGNWTNNGSGQLLNSYNGTSTMEGSSMQTISGTTSFNNLFIDNSNGVTISSGTSQIDNTLTLTSC